MKRTRSDAPATADATAAPDRPSLDAPFVPCDSCPGPAGVTVRLAGGGELLLCRHHARQHDQALLQQGAVIIGDYSVGGKLVPPRERTVAVIPVEDDHDDDASTRWWRWRRPRRDPVPPRPSLHRGIDR